MAKRGKVRLAGRFPDGARVSLYERRDGRLRPEGEPIATRRVSDGQVEFRQQAIEPDAKYLLVGNVNGQPLQVPVTASAVGESAEPGVQSQAPVQPDRVRIADGRYVDELTFEDVGSEPHGRFELQPGPKQEHARDVVQRSSTPIGSAHPNDPGEVLPYPKQEDYRDVVQMSSTETGMATPIEPTYSQADVPAGTVQRSDTIAGVATPIPAGGPVRAQRDKESSEAKASRGQPVQAAAQPIAVKKTSSSSQVDEEYEAIEPREPALAPTGPEPIPDSEASDEDAEGQPVDGEPRVS